MSTPIVSLMEVRDLDKPDLIEAIRKALRAVDQTIETGNHVDLELLTMCAACAVIWRQYYRKADSCDNKNDENGRERLIELLLRQGESLLEQITYIPATTIDAHRARAAIYLAWNVEKPVGEANLVASRLALALSLDLLQVHPSSAFGRYQDTLFERLAAVSRKPELLEEMIDEQIHQSSLERAPMATSPRLPEGSLLAKLRTAVLDVLSRARRFDRARRNPYQRVSLLNTNVSAERLSGGMAPGFAKLCTPKEGAIISGVVAALAVRLVGRSSDCRPELRSVSAAGDKQSRLDQAADVVVRCGGSPHVILCVLSHREIIDVVVCDRRRAAFQDMPAVREIIEFNPFDLAVHVFRRVGQTWSLETLSEPEEELKLESVEVAIPLSEIYVFV